MNKGRVVIVCYRPHAGKSFALRNLIKHHIAILFDEGLVVDQKAMAMEAVDGTVVEVFEWKSAEAIESAHHNPRIQKMWSDFSAVCDYIPIADVTEAGNLFSEFTPLDGMTPGTRA